MDADAASDVLGSGVSVSPRQPPQPVAPLTDADIGAAAPGVPAAAPPAPSPAPTQKFAPGQFISDAEMRPGLAPAAPTEPQKFAPGQSIPDSVMRPHLAQTPPALRQMSAMRWRQVLVRVSLRLLEWGGDVLHAADYATAWAQAHLLDKMGMIPAGQTADDLIQNYRKSAIELLVDQYGPPTSQESGARQFRSMRRYSHLIIRRRLYQGNTPRRFLPSCQAPLWLQSYRLLALDAT